ncbi:hypothetical protein [Polynucleobacter sp. es-EL-1]|uniref:hypothetical protein n=1 Tax=Polynucleobacter sp. es-EL-1 TaxID=1855652 RepID=UPI001BFE5AA9|nr:hypothetical protein [Polynucleobacter sp. es-EL-1]QWE10826.1 hypothetical protein FD974_01380 [Polynucleobacter sp. es-EL-1]
MSLLECLVGIGLSFALIAPLIQNSGELISKQIAYEKTQALSQDADRALELMGRSIRMAGYMHPNSFLQGNKQHSSSDEFMQIQKGVGYRGSDSLMVKYQLSKGLDIDCIGNALTADRTKKGLAFQGFSVNRQASSPKGIRANGGSLICQSLDRQGRLQNTTLMNGIHHLAIEEFPEKGGQNQVSRALKITLEMTDGALIYRAFERTFATRNLL